jgi:hypothetical protein
LEKKKLLLLDGEVNHWVGEVEVEVVEEATSPHLRLVLVEGLLLLFMLLLLLLKLDSLWHPVSLLLLLLLRPLLLHPRLVEPVAKK